jgi:plastocyanin
MRKFLVLVFAFLGCGSILAEEVTLPAAASIVGGAPFFSDVRAFNTSYTNDLTVEARYRCFIGNPCPTAQSVQFTLTPRESRAFDDIVVSLFNAPNTAGGIEFEHNGTSDQLVVTSRLFSTAPTPTVGMFIAGLDDSEAFPTTVLTSIRNGGPNAGFRTNVGVFNRQDAAATVTFTIFDGGIRVGNAVTRSVAGHSGVQVNRIFEVAGGGGHATENAVIVVSSDQPVFSYAAVIDNNTTDPIFVVGAPDQPLQAFTPTGPTSTPTQPAATATPTPTRTPTPPSSSTRVVNVGQGGTNFVDQVSGNSTSTIKVGDTIRWTWVGGTHSSTSGPCPPCTGDGTWNSNIKSSGTFERTFNTAGTFPYFCIPHVTAMTGTVVVNP